ncbi:MAG: DUF5675 family protein [Prevotella sp.]|nr:DUF5675 family protein [Prevotella sp.]
MKLVLIRHARRADYTIGRLEDENGMKVCDTLEPTWRDYKGGEMKIPRKSAIPEGTYRVVITKSQRFGKYLPLLVGVPGFEGVRIHAGNTSMDTEGCILVGHNLQVGKVLWSRITLEKLMKLIENEKEIFLIIKNTWQYD